VTQSDQTNLCACRIAQDAVQPADAHRPPALDRLRRLPATARRRQFRRRSLHLPRADRHRLHPQADRVSRGAAGARVRRRAGHHGRRARLRGRAAGRQAPQGPCANTCRNIDARIAAIFRRDQPSSRTGDTVIEAATRCSALRPPNTSARSCASCAGMDKPIAHHDRRRRQHRLPARQRHRENYNVKLIERNARRAECSPAHLPDAGACRRRHRRRCCSTPRTSTRWTCSSRSPTTTRTTSCRPAGQAHGRPRVVALINRKSYVDLVQGGRDRHRHLAGPDLHRHAARPRAPRRRGRRAQPAPRRGRGARTGGRTATARLQGGRPPHRGDRPARGRHHRRHRAQHGGRAGHRVQGAGDPTRCRSHEGSSWRTTTR
jgi:trk system potassium uptake protein TrkA